MKSGQTRTHTLFSIHTIMKGRPSPTQFFNDQPDSIVLEARGPHGGQDPRRTNLNYHSSSTVTINSYTFRIVFSQFHTVLFQFPCHSHTGFINSHKIQTQCQKVCHTILINFLKKLSAARILCYSSHTAIPF